MPDWWYRTVAQPALFRLNGRAARGVALGVVGALGRTRAGRSLIDFLGHMRADPRLGVTVRGTTLTSPIGLGWRVDPERRATRALAQFGAGFLVATRQSSRAVERAEGKQLRDVAERITCRGTVDTDSCVPVFWIEGEREEALALPSGARLPLVAWDTPASSADAFRAGVVLQVGERQLDGSWVVSAESGAELIQQVKAWRRALGDAVIVVSDGSSGPEEALALFDAGASLLIAEAAFVHSGPGLIKRCNEALAARLPRPEAAGREERSFFRHAWVWIASLGLALAAGGLATLALALTRVLLPYDENYLRLSSSQLRQTMPRLFAFMAHDRGTLAGVMLGLGAHYLILGAVAGRRRIHGAATIAAASSLTGFVSFFAFFGFGYFDTLHAFVAAILFQITVQIMVGLDGPDDETTLPVDREDAHWRRAQWGQLFWLIHAIGLLVAGAVILCIGMSSIVVREDLDFLCSTRAAMAGLGSDLLGVVAHDRATLGGMLLASGVAMLLTTLWCVRRGRAWVWSAMLALGAPAYAAAIGVHYWVGYVSWAHLAPAFTGAALWAAGLILTRGYLRGE